jgi:hypothetical protein
VQIYKDICYATPFYQFFLLEWPNNHVKMTFYLFFVCFLFCFLGDGGLLDGGLLD